MKTVYVPSYPATADRVFGKLWMGSAPPVGPSLSKSFDGLILAAMEYQPHPACFHGVKTALFPLDDGPPMSPDEEEAVMAASELAHGWLASGMKVIVTCFAGLNRSGVICAATVRLHGASPEEAVAAVREARGSGAMRNPHFLDFLERMRLEA